VAAIGLVAALGLSACASDNPPSSAQPDGGGAKANDDGGKEAGGKSKKEPTADRIARKACPAPADRAMDPARSRVVSGDGDRVRVEAVTYPLPRYEGRPWSQWGQGLVGAGGAFYSAVGDHCGVNGNAYVYELRDGRLRLVGDMLSAVEHREGDWGYGKIHAPLVPGPGASIYGSTYWGSDTGMEYGEGYSGDFLFRVDPDSSDIERIGVPIPKRGIPALASSPKHGLLYGEAVDGLSDTKQSRFFAYDVKQKKVVFQSADRSGFGFRSIMVDGRGRAYYPIGDHRLAVYDPETNEAHDLPARLPGVWMRAASAPAPDGTVYGVTREPDTLFALEPDGDIRSMGPVRGYVASIALDEAGERLFYVPDAHGRAWQQGAPVIAVDTSTGKDSVVVELEKLAEAELDLRLGGTYDVAYAPNGKLFIGMNAGPRSETDGFGSVVLLTVTLP
jgi:hypothetical protein